MPHRPLTGHSADPGRKRRWTAAELGSREWRVFAALVLLLIGGSTIYLAQDYRSHQHESERRLAATTDIVTEFVQQLISIVDLTLASIDDDRLSDDIVISRSPGELYPILKSAQSVSPVLQGLGITNAEGRVIASASTPQPSGADLSDRDYFHAHRNEGRRGLFIGRPVYARPQNIPALPVSRRLQTPAGAFAGVIAARVDPAYFSTFFASAGAVRSPSTARTVPRSHVSLRSTWSRPPSFHRRIRSWSRPSGRHAGCCSTSRRRTGSLA